MLTPAKDLPEEMQTSLELHLRRNEEAQQLALRLGTP